MGESEVGESAAESAAASAAVHWISVYLETTPDHAEAFSDALMAHGALSSSIEDANADTEQEDAIFGEPGEPGERLWSTCKVSGLFPAQVAVAQVVEAVARELGMPLPHCYTELIAEQDWVRVTQSQFPPIRISERLTITPSWHQPPTGGGISIRLDPGLAFGTGSHPTTRLCLRWLDQHLQAGQSVLDYGCGSGILAIAARLLGAGTTRGVDLDPQAVVASERNASDNGVEAEFGLPHAYPGWQADVVVANILANPLRMLAPLLAQATRPGGRIVLSGILAQQWEELTERYATWFEMDPPQFEDGWVCLSGMRRQVDA